MHSEIYFQCNKKLFRVLSCIKSIKKFYDFNDTVKNYDFCVPLMSLPLLFNTDLKTIPNSSYIYPEEKLVNDWNDKLKKKKSFKVGLFWQGSIRIFRI